MNIEKRNYKLIEHRIVSARNRLVEHCCGHGRVSGCHHTKESAKVKKESVNYYRFLCGALRNLVSFVQFKKREKHP